MSEQENVTFYGLGIVPKILELLERMKFKTPTPIQYKALPNAIEGKDVMGVAQTGTGKTLAFTIPMVQRLAQDNKGMGLILVPTRELAYQVDETVRKIAPLFGIRSVVLIGGASMAQQVRALRQRPRIIVATPGRLIDHLTEQKTVKLDKVSVLVLDEADRMLDMGFAPQIEEILSFVPKQRQTMLFSATMPKEIMMLATSHMQLPVNIEVAASGTVADHVAQELYIIKHDMKSTLLQKILEKYRGSVLLFSRTKHGARKLALEIRRMNCSAVEIHSDRSLAQRKAALEGFKTGRYRVLVATDIAARGIDVKGIELVINYDLPDDADNYVHRIGRTGRAGKEGRAISFATPDQFDAIRSIQKLIRIDIPIAKHPDVKAEEFWFKPKPKGHSSSRGHFSGRSFGLKRRRSGFSPRRRS